MGGLKFFDVKLDNQAGVYFGGDVVTGRLSMKLEDVKKARGNIQEQDLPPPTKKMSHLYEKP